MDITLGGTLPFLLFIVAFIVIITLYTPIIYQYDALAIYLIEGRQLVEGSFSLVGKWPTFGESMPLMPIIYSWFFYLSDAPILRLIPLALFFLTILLVYSMGRKLSPKNSHVAYISVVSLVSMTSFQWYMSKTSLYIDLCFMFFSASSIYALLMALDKESNRVNFFTLGINVALLLISKEYGIFLTWFIIGFLAISQYDKYFNKIYRALFYSLFLTIPFFLRNFSYLILYSFTENRGIAPAMRLNFLIIILSLLIQTIIFLRGEIKRIKFNLPNFTVFTVPLIIPTLFFIKNYLTLGSPLDTLKESYIELLYENGIVYQESTVINVSFLNIPNLFFSNSFLAVNLFPFFFFLLYVLIIRKNKIQDEYNRLLISWLFFSLLLFFYVTNGYIKGDDIRRVLILAVPVALIVGKGIHYLLEHYSLPYYLGNLLYISSISIYFIYNWFIKLDVTEWWLTNLESFINNFIYASPIEIIIYALPWFILFIFIKLRIKNHILSIIYYKAFWTKVSIIIMLISAITPCMMFIQAIKYPNSWNPSYYDEADSVKPYANHWHIPILNFYNSQLNCDNFTTIGFGVTPLKYFLERPFIDLNHPRNWLLYLPLFQELSTDELLSYLESLNARYFLIPTEVYGGRDRYESGLESSTLFKLIESSEIFTDSEGQMFYFKRLAEFKPLELYQLSPVSD